MYIYEKIDKESPLPLYRKLTLMSKSEGGVRILNYVLIVKIDGFHYEFPLASKLEKLPEDSEIRE